MQSGGVKLHAIEGWSNRDQGNMQYHILVIKWLPRDGIEMSMANCYLCESDIGFAYSFYLKVLPVLHKC